MPARVVTLRQFQSRHGEWLRLACRRCDRAGRYSVAQQIARHGPGLGLPDFRVQASADCPRHARVYIDSIGCGAYFPDLAPRS